MISKNITYTEISQDEAKQLYIKCKKVYVSTNSRKYWQLPPASAYSSHAPASSLFYRSLPEYEGEITYYKAK